MAAIDWISVKETLPGETEEVLLFDEKEGKWIGYYFLDSGKFIRSIDGYSLNFVTHWMDLPPNPAVRY